MYSKLIIVLIFFFIATLDVLAAEPFSRITRNDGVIINKCIDNFGKIDYCTVYDRKNANALLKNPQRYSIKGEVLISDGFVNNNQKSQTAIVGITSSFNQKSRAQTFSESCMNIQYAVGTSPTLVNTIINTINNFKD